MFNTLRELFETHVLAAGTDEAEVDREHELHLVTSALLLEVIHADHQVQEAEQEAIVALLGRVFHLDRDAVDELLGLAEQRVDAATSLYEFTSFINRELDAGRKQHIIELLWEVAYADGHLDKYEDYTIRKIADLIHVSHGQFIRAKHKVGQAAAGR